MPNIWLGHVWTQINHCWIITPNNLGNHQLAGILEDRKGWRDGRRTLNLPNPTICLLEPSILARTILLPPGLVSDVTWCHVCDGEWFTQLSRLQSRSYFMTQPKHNDIPPNGCIFTGFEEVSGVGTVHPRHPYSPVVRLRPDHLGKQWLEMAEGFDLCDVTWVVWRHVGCVTSRELCDVLPGRRGRGWTVARCYHECRCSRYSWWDSHPSQPGGEALTSFVLTLNFLVTYF